MTLKTKRQEAKAAAEAAAAAAADACAVCGLLYGDDAVKDDFWIACDKCNRWYHGVCVELTQVCFQAHSVWEYLFQEPAAQAKDILMQRTISCIPCLCSMRQDVRRIDHTSMQS